MKKYLVFLVTILSLGCSNDDNKSEGVVDGNLYSPILDAVTEAGGNFNGVLTVYPCNVATSAYYGNYSGSPVALKPFPGTYLISSGGYMKSFPAILLPLGDYEFIYWGVAAPTIPTYNQPASVEPPLTFGRIMKDEVISLRQTAPNSPVYYPVYDYVIGTQSIAIGTDSMTSSLKRVTGGLILNLTHKDNVALSSSIKSIHVLISGIAKSVNFYTGEPTDYSATVRFPLTIATDRLLATNDAVMLFPSESNPIATINIVLNDGTTKTFTKTLLNHIDVGVKLTINVELGEIITTPSGGDFEVNDWSETTENITIGS